MLLCSQSLSLEEPGQRRPLQKQSKSFYTPSFYLLSDKLKYNRVIHLIKYLHTVTSAITNSHVTMHTGSVSFEFWGLEGIKDTSK